MFAVGFVVYAVVLLALIGDQTRWVEKTKLFAQPRFWPAVGLGGMVLMGGLHLYRLPWRHVSRYDWGEARRWVTVGEYALWFLAYVMAVPILGYLPMTLLFVPALAWRMGYRSRKMMLISVVFSVSVVVLFKTMLSVKIPGGLIYEYLPGALRSFFILNF